MLFKALPYVILVVEVLFYNLISQDLLARAGILLIRDVGWVILGNGGHVPRVHAGICRRCLAFPCTRPELVQKNRELKNGFLACLQGITYAIGISFSDDSDYMEMTKIKMGLDTAFHDNRAFAIRAPIAIAGQQIPYASRS